jgi:PAS domain S-box-containing protein
LLVDGIFLVQLLHSELKKVDGMDLLRILHVDDDPSILEISKSILELEADFVVEDAPSVDEALRKLVEQAYDMVISDFEMPNKSGLDFLKELREQKNMIPFALFTGKGREEVAMTALNLGADGYYTKQGETETVYGELVHGIRLATERAKAISVLEESERRYRTLLEQAADAIFVYNLKGQVVDANRQACISLGYTKKELLSLTISDIDAEAAEHKKEGLFWPKLLTGESITFESTQKRKDGNVFCVEVTLGRTVLDKETLIIGIMRDTTESNKEKQYLKESQHKMEIINEKLHVVGALTRHDVRNKIASVEGNAYLARKKLPADSDALSYLNRIESSVDQITRIFDFASVYERLGLEELVDVNVEKIVEEAVSLFSDLQNVKIINDCQGLTVLADSLLNNLFFNLIDNSLKHGKQTSQIRIYYKKENAGTLRLVYEDNGVGVPFTEKPKIFKEGYTTSGSVGYGLYLIKKIIDVYGWSIQETGEPGKGAKFAIKIAKLNKN